MKVEPFPSSVESRMRPPCSRTMPWLIESPSPVPSPSGLVVKNGSNTWAAMLSGIPGPLSVTSTATPSSQRRARTTMVPGRPVDAIAWAALLIRLTNTCWIWLGSMSGMGRSASTSSRASTRCAMSWFRSSRKVASSSGLSAVGRRWCSCFRAKVSRFFTMLLARSASSWITVSGSRRESGT